MWGYKDCGSVTELLWNYAAHRLSEQDVERVELHIATCDHCRAEASAYRQTVDALATMRQHPVPDSRRGWHEMRGRLAEAQSRRTVPAPMFRMPVFAWSIAAVAAAGLFLVLTPAGNVFRPHPNSEGVAIVAPSNGQYSRTVIAAPAVKQSESEVAQIDPDELRAFANTRPDPANAAAVHTSARQPRHLVRRPTQLALALAATEHRRVSAGAFRLRATQRVDYRKIDGGRAASSGDNSEFVLTPVAVESNSSADYVMGRVIMNRRSDDVEVARGW